ncbi:MAG TPA: HD domain-containing protein [Candidatus Dormibacteraeota bacterium]|nr:HD domain-containing protein [Candidatus Dormibacteraeota bacterium]
MADLVTTVHTAPHIADVLLAIRDAARAQDIEAYVVGGFVRDRLLGNEGKDIDLLVVDADAVPLLAALADTFDWSRPQVFERFGTAQVRGDGFIVEAVRARAERYDPESRKPSVTPGTLDEDIWRRDFTVNALAQTLDGEILDRTGRGISDLYEGILRTPLDARDTFSEDPLRMYRAARFVAQLGFRLAGGVLDAMRAVAPRAEILSVERVAEELRRMLVSPHPRAGIDVLRDSGLLQVHLPELLSMIGVEQSGYHVYDVYDHTMVAVEHAPPDLLTRVATLLHDVGKPRTHAIADDGRHTFHDHPDVGARMSRTILERLRFANDEIDAVELLVRHHLRPIQYDATTFGDSAVRRIMRDTGEQRHRLLDVARADTRASAFPDLAGIDGLGERMRHLEEESGAGAVQYTSPLDGEEIMAMAGGRPPGRWVGAVKKALSDAVVEGDVPPGDAEAARRWLAERPELLRTD